MVYREEWKNAKGEVEKISDNNKTHICLQWVKQSSSTLQSSTHLFSQHFLERTGAYII